MNRVLWKWTVSEVVMQLAAHRGISKCKRHGARDGVRGRIARALERRRRCSDLEPAEQVVMADAAQLDEVARAFADVIDAKSPYTFNHSVGVAETARFIAAELGMDAEEQRRIFRAGLLHDIGKLGVSSKILDKPGPLDRAEWAELQRHPTHSLSILSRVAAFGSLPGRRPFTTRSSTAADIRGSSRRRNWMKRRGCCRSPTSMMR